MKKILTTLSILCLPNFLCLRVLILLGHKVHVQSYIGFSVLWVDRIYLDAGAFIGHFNLFVIPKLLMRKQAKIKSRNRVRGPVYLLLGEGATISVSNSIYRAPAPVSYGISFLRLGRFAHIVSKHHLDCTRSIEIGDFSTIGGLRTQFWTHGYFHGEHGSERLRVDGEIRLGKNVYVGSACVFNPGVSVANGVCVGAAACISKNLDRRGMYVAQSLRYIDKDINDIRDRFDKVKHPVIEEVYEKVIA